MDAASLGTYNSFVSDQCAITSYNKNPFIWCLHQKPLKRTSNLKRRAVRPRAITTVTIPNVLICADAITHGAYCQYTRSGQSQTLNQAQWDQLRFGWFCMGADALAEYQKFIESSCNYNKDCVSSALALNRTISRLKARQTKARRSMGLVKKTEYQWWRHPVTRQMNVY
jgi:hypothetical protein